jgi:hypothetical protein
MQNDIISRSALIAELEAFKMPMGDVVLRFIVDRVIGIVKGHPGVEPEGPVRFEMTPTGLKFFYKDGRVMEILP